jgi:iron complex transport system substrate-binding protein
MAQCQKLYMLSGIIAGLLLTLVLAACGDPTATTAPATTTRAVTTAASTTAAATTAAATTAAATTAATTIASTTVAATTAAVTTAPATTAASTTVASATTAASGGATTTTYPLTITDDAKRTVKFDKAPAKIVSLAPSNTELLYQLGLGDKIVGVDDFSNYPEEAKQKEKVGGFSQTNLEKVASLSPDLVLAAGITSKELLTSLETRKLTVVVLNPSNLAGVAANMKLLGQIAGVPAKGEQEAGNFQKKLDDIASKVKGSQTKPRVFYELDPTLFTVGPGSFIDDMIQKAGGQNIVTDTSNPYPQLSQEVVISKDPEIILLGDDSGGADSPEKILSRPGWSNISAVKNKRVVAINADLVNRPGPRAALGVEALAKAFYPDLFK